MLSLRLSYRTLAKAGAVIPPKESLPDQFFVRTGPFSLTYTAVPGEVQRWGTCDYEASEPPFSSIWPVRSWLPFGKIHFNPTFFIPHRPFLNPHRQRSALSVRRRPLRRTATRLLGSCTSRRRRRTATLYNAYNKILYPGSETVRKREWE